MRIAEVIGRVTLARVHPSLRGARFVIALPLPGEALAGDSPRRGEEVIAYDDLGASPGARIALSEGAEAANPFLPVKKPVDAYTAALIDQINL